MQQFNIDYDEAAVAKIKEMVAGIKNGHKKVLVKAINQTASTTKVQAKARIGNELNLEARRIGKDLTVQKANYAKISGAVISKGKPVGLINFGANPVLKGVSVKVLRAGKRSLLKHAFIATGRSTSTEKHVFWRDERIPGKKFSTGKISKVAWQKMPKKYRLPLERKTGPRIEDIFASAKVFEPVTIQSNFLLLKNTAAQVSELLRRYAIG